MKSFLNFIIGIFLGAGAILPGISSGVICVSLGLYEKLIDSILNFFKNIKKNTIFLFPILSGIFIGIVLFGNIIKYLFNYYYQESCFCFMGLILGNVFSIIKNTNEKKIQIPYLICTIITFTLSIFLVVLEKNTILNYTATSNFLGYFLSGLLMSIGVVIPGISSTIILMLCGTYTSYISAISLLNLKILFPMGLGLIIGGFVFLKLIQIVLKKYPVHSNYCIIGFVFGSILILYPGININLKGILSIVLFVISFYIAKKFSKN